MQSNIKRASASDKFGDGISIFEVASQPLRGSRQGNLFIMKGINGARYAKCRRKYRWSVNFDVAEEWLAGVVAYFQAATAISAVWRETAIP